MPWRRAVNKASRRDSLHELAKLHLLDGVRVVRIQGAPQELELVLRKLLLLDPERATDHVPELVEGKKP